MDTKAKLNYHANASCQKSTVRFPAKRRWHPPPPFGLPWSSPPHSPESVRAGGRTLTSEPNFLASIGNQNCLTMVLRELCHLLNGVNGVVSQDSCFRSYSTCNPPKTLSSTTDALSSNPMSVVIDPQY